MRTTRKATARSWILLTLGTTLLGAISCADTDTVSPSTPDGRLSAANGASCSAAAGQQLLEQGGYRQAINEFTCVIDNDPTGIDGYRGRIEAQLMLGRFSDAVLDYARVNAFVVPVHPDAAQVISAGYAARLKVAPDDVQALTGQSFAYWWFFSYASAIQVLDHLVAVAPDDVYGNLFMGSSRLLRGRMAGVADLERAISLAPDSPDVRFIVADAYTYGAVRDPQRAFDEATFALNKGLNTPRIRAIRAASYIAFGDAAAAGAEIRIHLDMVTTELVSSTPLQAGSSLSLDLVPGRTWDIPLPVAANETVPVLTSGKGFFDTILILIAPDGTTVLGSDDYRNYFAGFDWVAPAAGTYKLRVTSFEGTGTGTLSVSRK